MNDEIQVLLPKLGESIHSATIVQWFKKVGDHIRLDEPLLEVSTDKVNSEIPSPAAGILKEIHALPDQELQVGALIAVIVLQKPSHIETAQPAPSHPALSSTASQDAKTSFLSPALLRLVKEAGISMDMLEKIPGTGMGGRLTKRDVEAYIATRTVRAPCPLAATASSEAQVERLKMSSMRKAIAENMVRSFYEAPHASLVTEVDVTAVLKLMQREKETFLQRHGFKLTITAFVVRAIVRALQAYPLLNSSLENDTILVKRFINVGIAVSVEQGLLVPVIRHCEGLRLSEIAQHLNGLANRARIGKLAPDEVNGGTITLTNFGMSGVQIGVPIIRYPEVAIVGIGAIHKKVVPLEEDTIGIRSMMHICLTFDHRVLDGMYGCGFLAALKQHLEAVDSID